MYNIIKTNYCQVKIIIHIGGSEFIHISGKKSGNKREKTNKQKNSQRQSTYFNVYTTYKKNVSHLLAQPIKNIMSKFSKLSCCAATARLVYKSSCI